MACMNKSTNENMYTTTKVIEFFYIIASHIIDIESPIINETNVVTLLAKELKKLTFGKRHIPRKVYAKNTGKNYIKKNMTFTILNFINSYINTSFFLLLKNLKIVIQEVKQLIPIIIYLSRPIKR